MDEVLLFPRLPIRTARARLSEIATLSIDELSLKASVEHPDAVYPATGGNRVSTALLSELRESLLSCAKKEGFPRERRNESAAQFDSAAGSVLAALPIVPGEAARNEVWAYLTLIILPDIAVWRFPERNEERFLGGVRNTFQRIWWRAHLLRDRSATDEWHLLRLQEDALVGLMERPAISSNPLVARAIAQMIERIASTASGKREDTWRDAYKRVRQRIPLVNLDCLTTRELESQLGAIEAEAKRHIAEISKPR